MAPTKNPAALIGLFLVLAAAVAALIADRKGRSEAAAAAAKIDLLLDHQGVPAAAIETEPKPISPADVMKAVGRPPMRPMAEAGDYQLETYAFGSLRKYHLHVFYTKGAAPALVRYSLYSKS